LSPLAALLIAVALAFGISSAMTPTAAHAGSNGQQLNVCPSFVTQFGSATIVGPNQNGIVTMKHVDWLPWYDLVNGDYRCQPVAGWWWKGTVTIYWYKADGSYFRSSTCTVKESTVWGYNWQGCEAPAKEARYPGEPFDSTIR
jgi:hypothetical protein